MARLFLYSAALFAFIGSPAGVGWSLCCAALSALGWLLFGPSRRWRWL